MVGIHGSLMTQMSVPRKVRLVGWSEGKDEVKNNLQYVME
jgi:hypothetical protein